MFSFLPFFLFFSPERKSIVPFNRKKEQIYVTNLIQSMCQIILFSVCKQDNHAVQRLSTTRTQYADMSAGEREK
jgi:hypothetical protein